MSSQQLLNFDAFACIDFSRAAVICSSNKLIVLLFVFFPRSHQRRMGLPDVSEMSLICLYSVVSPAWHGFLVRMQQLDIALFALRDSPDGPISLGTVMARRRTKSRGLWDFIIISAGDSAGLSNLRAKQGALPFCTGSCVHANLVCPPWGGSFDGNECRLTRPWWMLHAQQGLAAPSYTACLVCLYRCFHAASPGILWNWLSRTCEEHVQCLLEQANWC